MDVFLSMQHVVRKVTGQRLKLVKKGGGKLQLQRKKYHEAVEKKREEAKLIQQKWDKYIQNRPPKGNNRPVLLTFCISLPL